MPLSDIESYFHEINSNLQFKDALMAFRKNNSDMRDSTMAIARREGWYAFVRAIKPRLVVETGVHHGVGALTICTALQLNHEEGFEGEYVGVDVNPTSGILLTKPFNIFGKVEITDSLEFLKNNTTPIDLFINDSDHNEEYEAKEYALIKCKLGKNAIILGDNSHASDALRTFSIENGRDFLFFKEEPLDHFYYGAGIGISFKSSDFDVRW
jgi:predicted O-methyltransferase YrrM